MNLKVRDITITAIFTALTAILAQISIPLPFSPVPITFQVMAVYISAIILGSRLGTLSQIIYILVGAVGIPIFVNFQGGLNVVFGPSGGYLISYPIVAFIAGKISDKSLSHIQSTVVLIASLLLCYGMGVIQLSFITNITIKKALVIGVLPFIPLDVIKITLAYLLGEQSKDGSYKNPSHKMLTLRAHHLLCIQGYKGYGYSMDFTKNMDKIVYQLKKDTFTRIKVISEVDEICCCCPNNTKEKLCRYEIKIKSIDKNTLNLLNLELNQVYTYKHILNIIHKKINHKNFENICGTCRWFKYGYCKEGLGLY